MTPGKIYEITDPRIENTSRHRRWLELARKKAMESPFDGPRMACLLVIGGRVHSIGVNKPQKGILKNRHYKHNQSLHAEISALHNIDPKVLKGATIYVVGLQANQDSPTWSSKCCPACQKVMRDAGIKKVIYHDKDFQPYIWRVS